MRTSPVGGRRRISCYFSPFCLTRCSLYPLLIIPYLSSTRRSRDIDAGMVSTSLYPLAAAMKARPMPVLPLVGSTRVVCWVERGEREDG